MKKKLIMIVLTIFTFLMIAADGFAVEISDFQGRWVAKYMVQDGISVAVDDVPVDVVLQIDGYVVSLTSQAMHANNDKLMFNFVNNRLETDGGDLYYILELQEDGTLRWNMSNMMVYIDFILEKDGAQGSVQESERESIKRGDSGTDIRKLQERLVELGYLDTIDSFGTFGENEEEAVKFFQSVYGFEETGVADELLLAIIYDSGVERAPVYTNLQKGKKGDEVKKLQQRLIDVGWLNGNADGDFGGKTEEAIKKFQRAVGISATGIADTVTQRKLFSDNAPDGRKYGDIQYPLTDKNYVYEYNGYKVEVLGYEYSTWRNYTGDSGKPAVVVRFYFENGTDIPLYLLECYSIKVFQDGIELDYISLNSDDNEAHNMIKEIKSGAGLYCKMVFQTISDSDTELIIAEPTMYETMLGDIQLKK